MLKVVETEEIIKRLADSEIHFDAVQDFLQIILDCPEPKHLIQTPVVPMQRVWTADGIPGYVESIYLGKNGIQRFFVALENGEKMNFKQKGIGKDIFLECPV